MAIERRKFIKTSIIALAGLGTATGLSYLAIPKYEAILKLILEHDLKSLKIQTDAIDQFIEAALKEDLFGNSKAKKEMIRIYHFMANTWFPLPYQYKYDQYRADIVGKFLLSTNFFYNKMDESKEIKYLRVYNAYKFPCGNPFSNLFYPLSL